MTSGRGKDRSDLERTTCINATRTDCGTKLRAATCHAPGLGTAQVTRFTAGADEPYEGILHVRVCGGRRGQPRLLPGNRKRPSRDSFRDYLSASSEVARRSSESGIVSMTLRAAGRSETGRSASCAAAWGSQAGTRTAL